MKKNIIYWIGIKNPQLSKKYGDYDYFEYSKNSWRYWCKQNDCLFVEFDKPVKDDLFKFRVNWQKIIFIFDELERKNIKYDQICLVDSSCMIKWDTPNFFNMDNMKWIYDSIIGYRPFFNDFKLDQSKYVNSGFIIFNEEHKGLINGFKKLYLDNTDEFVELQDKIVKKGTEQTPLNYWLQMNSVDVNIDLPMGFKLTHMHRKSLFGHNWQLNEDKTPYFVKYGYNWIFNGIPKDQRSQIMKQTWDLVKDNYLESPILTKNILDEIEHKDTAKYTTTREFKKDLLEIFNNGRFKDKTIVEIGASQGQSTRLLSHVFKKVIAVEWDDWNLEQAKKRTSDRNNVELIKMDLYTDKWEDFLPTEADVVFIDAGHQYHQVKSDILNSIKLWGNPIFIFDDYGVISDVKQAIDEQISQGSIKLSKWIGSTPETFKHAKGTKMLYGDREGCICNLI